MRNSQDQQYFVKFAQSIMGGLAIFIGMSAMADIYLGKLGRYVPHEGNFTADIKVLDFTPEVRALTDKLQSNIDANSTWFTEFTQQNPAGQSLPFHSNFGISESEYQRVLTGEQNKVLDDAGKTQLAILFRGDQIVRVTGLPGEAPFDGLLYEPVSDSILSSYGTLTKSVQAEGTMGTINGLSWSGRLWKLNESNQTRQIEVIYVLGELKDQSKNVLIHQIAGFVNQQPIDYHYMLVWDKK